MRRTDELFIAERPMVIRPLDTTEGIFWVFAKHGAFSPAHVAVVEGPIDAALLTEALVRVQARHPILRARIVETETGPHFAPGPVVSGPWFTRRVPPERWAAEAERALNLPPPPPEALPWRVGLLEGPTLNGPHGLLLNLHHSLTDGLGTLRILEDLLIAFAEIRNGRPPERGLPSLPELPPMDAVLLPPPTRRELLRHRARNVARRLRPEKTRQLPFEGMAVPSERRTGVLFREIPSEIFAPLHHLAREQKASVNGVLSVLALDAVAAIFGGEGRLGLSTQVNLRGRCQPAPPPTHVGCFVSNVVTRHALTDRRTLWERARELSSEVQKPLERREPQVALHAGKGRLRAFERAMAALAADPASQGRMGALSLSNRGAIQSRPHGPFRLKALYSPAGIHELGPTLQLSFGSLADNLFCTLSYPRPLVSERTARAFLHAFAQRLAQVAPGATHERKAQ